MRHSSVEAQSNVSHCRTGQPQHLANPMNLLLTQFFKQFNLIDVSMQLKSWAMPNS